ncbi:MAG: hypothetical protein N3F62_00500 [Bacteroidia bacterium]|nr:hypothetical protein [Bacteroidia bacterium]
MINAAFITIIFNVSNVLAQSQNWWRTNGNTPGFSDFLGTSNHSPLIIKTNNLERLRIDANGNIGIGSANPQYLLDVNGRSKFRFTAYFDSLLQCSSLKVTQLSGTGSALLSTDAQGNIQRFNFSGNNQDVLTGNGNWTNVISLLPAPLWQSSGQNIFYNYGYVGIGTSNPLFALDVFGDVRVSNNIYVGGGIVISDKVNAITEVTTSKVLATEATLSKMRADSIMMDSTKAIYGNTIVRGDVRLENKLTIQGDAKFNGQVTATQGLMFDGIHGMKYIQGSNGGLDYIVVGKVGLPALPVSTCITPTVHPSPIFNPGGWMQLYWNNTSLEFITDGANSLIESSGNGSLLMNYYCGKDVVVGNNSSGNLIANRDVYVNGNIGIGTNTPTERLQVEGTIKAGHSNKYVRMGFNTAHHFIDSDEALMLNWYSKKDVSVGHPSGGNLLVNQKLGIKTSNPIADLQVEGTVGINLGAGNLSSQQINNALANNKLVVNGSVLATEYNAKLSVDWPDYVFNQKVLPSLLEIEKFIKQYKHLPDFKSANYYKENGMGLVDIIIKQQENIEKIYLYLIELKKENEMIKKELKQLKEKQ